MFFLSTQILESNSRRVKSAFLKIQEISHIHKIDEIFVAIVTMKILVRFGDKNQFLERVNSPLKGLQSLVLNPGKVVFLSLSFLLSYVLLIQLMIRLDQF